MFYNRKTVVKSSLDRDFHILFGKRSTQSFRLARQPAPRPTHLDRIKWGDD